MFDSALNGILFRSLFTLDGPRPSSSTASRQGKASRVNSERKEGGRDHGCMKKRRRRSGWGWISIGSIACTEMEGNDNRNWKQLQAN